MVSKFTSQPDGKEIAEKINDIIDNTNLGDLKNVSISSPSAGQNLTYDATNQVWKNTSTSATVAWGGITGTLADQTDLQNALNAKQVSGNYVTIDTEQTITSKKTFNTRVNFLGTGDANAIYLSTDTRIDVNGTNNTVLGFASGTFLINHDAYNLKLRGKQTRPAYNTDTNYLALLSDVPSDTGDLTNNAGFITGITSTDVTTALGYTPYSSLNPNGYTSNVGTVTSVNNVSPVNGNVTLSIPSEVTENTVSGWGFTKNTGTVTSVNNVSPVSGNVTLSIPSQASDIGAQPTLVSGTNIKTINNTSLLGSGDITISSAPDIDNTTITENSSNKLQTVAVIDQNSGYKKVWTGTRQQYDAILTKDSNTLYNITDDTDVTLSLLELLYPVGSIYIGTMQTCPLASLGVGTWQLVATDRVLQGAGTRGSVGSTVNESLPNITGGLYTGGSYGSNIFTSSSGAFTNESAVSNWRTNTTTQTVSGASDTVTFSASSSSSTYQNNVPVQQDAYLVNIWERVS